MIKAEKMFPELIELEIVDRDKLITSHDIHCYETEIEIKRKG
jgi:hypothetical protein